MTASLRIPLADHLDRISAKGKGGLKLVVNTIYPPRCLACPELTETGSHLCGKCWAEATFITGTVCTTCGTPLPGVDYEIGVCCDGCITYPPAWDRGAAAFIYDGSGRRMVLALKHGDRLDMARPLANWMARSGGNLLDRADLIAPVPLHWQRLLKRRYNQSAELVRYLSKSTGKPAIQDLLLRTRRTKPQEGMNRGERGVNQVGAFRIQPKHSVDGKKVLLVDDVMTSGATLSACAEVLRAAGANHIDVLVLARVARLE